MLCVCAQDYIAKPFSKLELLARLDTQLNLRRSWQLELERERSDVLLREMLPHHIISRLMCPSFVRGKDCIADEHKAVVVLFSDVVGFTSLAAKTPTPEIIRLLNEMFSAFDAIAEDLGVYKVETIGDASSSFAVCVTHTQQTRVDRYNADSRGKQALDLFV